MKFNVTIEGIRPLLQNRFNVPDEEPTWHKVRGARDFSEDVGKALYVTADGKVYQPADHIVASMEKAATSFQIPGKGKKTYKELVKSAVFVYPDEVLHLKPCWKVDRRPVVIKGARIVKERPIFADWKLSFVLESMDEQFPADALKAILEHAGRYKGIGDYRPRFGLFKVTQFEAID